MSPHAHSRDNSSSILAPLALIGLMLITVVVYWPGLHGPLVLDDRPNLEALVAMEQGQLTWREVLANSKVGAFGRPVALASFIANWLVTGSDVWALKATNLFLHLLCGLLLFFLSERLLLQDVAEAKTARWWIALWITAMWLLAPLFVSTVLYVIQRMAQLATLFTLAGLLAYVVGRQVLEEKERQGLILITCCLVLCWPLAVLSKENGILLPLLALLFEVYFFQGAGQQRRRLLRVLILIVLVLGAGFALNVLTDSSWLSAGYAARDFSLWERSLTQGRVLFDYLGNLLLVPGSSPMGVYHDDYIISSGLTRPLTTLGCLSVWLLLLGVAWFSVGSRVGLLLFGPVFFLSAHLVESTVLPLELYFEHRNYLPSIGIFFSLGLGGYYAYRLVRFRRLLIAVFLAFPILFAGTTASRVQVWRTWEGIVLAAETAHPNAPRVHTALASVYINRDEIASVAGHLDRARALYDGRHDAATALHRLAAFCVVSAAASSDDYAWLESLEVLTDDRYTLNTLDWLVGAIESESCPGLDARRVAESLWKMASEQRTDGAWGLEWRLSYDIARLLGAVQRKAEALELLEQSTALHTEQPLLSLLAIQLQLELGQRDAARRILESLLLRKPDLNLSQRALLTTYEATLNP